MALSSTKMKYRNYKENDKDLFTHICDLIFPDANMKQINEKNIYLGLFGSLFVIIILCCITGSLIYLAMDGRKKIYESKKLVISTSMTATDDSISYQNCVGSGSRTYRCTTYFVTPFHYIFNTQPKNIKLTSKIPYFKNEGITITVDKTTGEPLKYQDTKLYISGGHSIAFGITLSIISGIMTLIFIYAFVRLIILIVLSIAS